MKNTEDPEEIKSPVADTVETGRNKRRLVLYAIIILLALFAIGGIMTAIFTPSIDPASVTPPVTLEQESAADEKPPEISVPTASITPQIPAQTPTPVSPVLPGLEQQSEAPLELPSQKNARPLSPSKSIAPQSIMQWHAPADKNAPLQPVARINGKAPQIVIVIDDMGLNQKNSRLMASLDPGLTLSYMPYAEHLTEQTKSAYENGHELIVHMPMEPDDIKHNNPGPDALLTINSAEENIARLNRNLNKFGGYVIGMNNHMGSRMTSDENAMRPVMQAFKEKGLWFLDSRTIGNSVAGKLANEMHIPYVERDVFLDNTESVAAILKQLQQVEQSARRKGYAVAIGHPYTQTITALQQWLPHARSEGFKLVPLSTVIAERFPSMTVPRYARMDRTISVATH